MHCYFGKFLTNFQSIYIIYLFFYIVFFIHIVSFRSSSHLLWFLWFKNYESYEEFTRVHFPNCLFFCCFECAEEWGTFVFYQVFFFRKYFRRALFAQIIRQIKDAICQFAVWITANWIITVHGVYGIQCHALKRVI